MPLVVVLALAGVVPAASAPAGLPRPARPLWPYPERPCAQQPRTPAPGRFGAEETFGGQEPTDITGVAFERRGGHTVAVAASPGGTWTWALPGLTPIGGRGPARPLAPEAAPAGRMNGRTVRVTAGDELRAVDPATGRRVGRAIYLGEDNTVRGLVVFPRDGRLIAAVNDDGGDENEPGPDHLTLWDLAAGTRAGVIEGDFATVRKATIGGRTVLLTPNLGGYAPAGGAAFPPAGTVSVWDAATLKEIARLPGNPPPRSLHDPSSRSVREEVRLAVGRLAGRPVALTGGADNTVRLWDLTTARPIAATTPAGHVQEIVAFTVAGPDDRKVVVSAGADGAVMVWDLATRRRIGPPLPGPAGVEYPVFTGASQGEPLIMTLDGGVRHWRLDAAGRFTPALPGAGAALIISFHGRLAYLGEESGRLRLRDLATRTPIGAPVPVGRDQPAARAVVTRLAGRDVVADVRSRIRIWDLATGRRIGVIPGVRSFPSRDAPAAAAQARCTTLLLSGAEKTVRVWDLRTGGESAPLVHGALVGQIETGVIGDRPIAVTTGGDTVKVWDLTDGTLIASPIQVGPRYGTVHLVQVDGRTLLIRGGRDERLRLWDLGGRRDDGPATATPRRTS
ncbi:hypothetical protein Sme01_68260 [Sphaerisporangium melleum]|uniref:Uncharacterized protein n=1 Tax=Sphaerisporangium melleum TaxID=321316 RepID=A0A917RHL9_9ACTN|nr:hypothetical protein GCM10007964_58350 [Sphaerisporangium melleum]GII74350.1 hypothetical protein Sme01_68260 [Sphaerisporangium melleum]